MHKMKDTKLFHCLIFLLLISFIIPPAVIHAADEAPARVFEGKPASAALLANLDYQDVKNSDTWAKNAIWETGALELMKGYGAKRFGLSDMLTIEQAIAVAYNMAGREAEAQLAAEALDLERATRKNFAPAMWSDGYLQLALNDGLLTQEEYDDAFAADQSALEPSDFRRSSPVTREDMAFYVARTMGLNPVYPQTHLFNSYADWQQANPHRIPYIEAVLQNRIMNGSNGRFDPKGPVTREQAAQLLQNAEPFLFSRLNMEKLKGTVEKIASYDEKSNGRNILVTEVNVRSGNGLLHRFRFSRPNTASGVNEQTGDQNAAETRGTIVNLQGVLENEDALRVGQEIVYFVRNNQVQYVIVLAEQKNTAYYLVKILSADSAAGTIRCEFIQEVPFSDARLLGLSKLSQFSATGDVKVLTVSKAADISIDFAKKTFGDIKPETLMLLTLENNIVTAMEKVNSGLFQEEGIISGILEEMNPVLGYVTLYFSDGSGTSPDAAAGLSSFRTYSWLHADEVEIYKNGSAARLEDLKPGDSVFIKLDENGVVTKMSGADNYYPVYGKIITKGNGIQLRRDNGAVEWLQIPGSTPIFSAGRRISLEDLSEGDNVRILLQTSGNQVIIGEINVEKERIEASGVYKAKLVSYDSLSKSLVVMGLQQFINGVWQPSQNKGAIKLTINGNYSPELPKGAQGTVYLALGENVLGNDTVVRMFLDDSSLTTEVVSDTILQAQPGTGNLTLMNGNLPIAYGDDSLIIRGGKLLEPNQVKNQDEATIVVGNLPDGSKKANLVWLREPAQDTGLTLLRGRITQIDALSSMTLQSFSQFRSPSWEYNNVPKTLTLDSAVTRLFDDDGRTDIAIFDDTGTPNYKNRTVYVLAQEGTAKLISTAPYGDVVYTGRIQMLNGAVRDSFGQLVTPPSSMQLGNVYAYNPGNWNWESKPNTEFSFLANTVFYGTEGIIDAGQLKVGDTVTVIRTASGNNALVVMVDSY